MRPIVNLNDLENEGCGLQGEISLEELDIETRDECLRVAGPATYQLQVELVSGSLLIRGTVRVPLACLCVRCLKAISRDLTIADWQCLVPLAGEDAVPLVDRTVDLTPWVREDIVLSLPQHPLCDTECRGLSLPEQAFSRESSGESGSRPGVSPWEQLNKLKL
ncbi:MAG: DUF177 domain-containing protein [Verrucomicrobia bacterium]|nr:DUF177 domain-containing protein [Verrucomicrobiota bacterium]